MPDIETEGYEEQSQLVQTETTGMHEMKVYNETRDKIHSYLSVLKQLNNVGQISSTIIEIQNLLNTAHSLWTEINEAFAAKYAKLKATGSPVYSGELKLKSNELNAYLKYLRYLDNHALYVVLCAYLEQRIDICQLLCPVVLCSVLEPFIVTIFYRDLKTFCEHEKTCFVPLLLVSGG